MCNFCDRMREWCATLPKLRREAGVYLEFGAMMSVRQMKDGKEIRFILDKSIPRIAFCPVCGASIRKRMREWRKAMSGCLQVMTRDGISIHVLPDTARCSQTGKSPLEMDRCPIYNFDDHGEICCPDKCDEYTEEAIQRTCETCRNNLGGGYNNCRISLESECADGGYEAWEPKA